MRALRRAVKIGEQEVSIHSSSITTVDTAQDLGIILDSRLTMSAACVAQHTASESASELREIVRSVWTLMQSRQ